MGKKNRAQEASVKRKERFLEAFAAKAGNISSACEAIGISRRAYYRWLDTDLEFAARVEEVRETLLDFAESNLLSLIKDKNVTAIIFYLKTQGKHRGYLD